MKVKGKWDNNYTPKQLQDRLNEKPNGFLEDLGGNLKYDMKEFKNTINESAEELGNKIRKF